MRRLEFPTPVQARRSLQVIPYLKRLGQTPDEPESRRIEILEEMIEEMGATKAALALAEFAWTLVGSYAAANEEISELRHVAPRPFSATATDLFRILEAFDRKIIADAQ